MAFSSAARVRTNRSLRSRSKGSRTAFRKAMVLVSPITSVTRWSVARSRACDVEDIRYTCRFPIYTVTRLSSPSICMSNRWVAVHAPIRAHGLQSKPCLSEVTILDTAAESDVRSTACSMHGSAGFKGSHRTTGHGRRRQRGAEYATPPADAAKSAHLRWPPAGPTTVLTLQTLCTYGAPALSVAHHHFARKGGSLSVVSILDQRHRPRRIV